MGCPGDFSPAAAPFSALRRGLPRSRAARTLKPVPVPPEQALRAAVDQERAGLLAAAESAYRQVLEGARGTGSEVERQVTINLARLCANDGREFEAFALASCARDLAAAAGDAWRLALAQLQLANALDAVEDYDAIPGVLDRVAGGLDLFDPADASGLRLSVALHRARLAANLGDVDAARAALAEAHQTSLALHGRPASDRIVWFVNVVALNQAGRQAEAEPWLDRMPPSEGIVRRELEYAEQRAWCLLAVRPVPAGMDAAISFLDALGRAPVATVGAAWRLRAAVNLGARLVAVDGAEEARRIAWDVAGHAILTRVSQIEQCVRTLPELTDVGAEVFARLAAYRTRFRDRHEQVLREVAAARPWPPVDARSSLRPGLTVVCAWCARVRAEDGAWLPIRQFVPAGREDFKLSHGICTACWEQTVGDLAAYAQTRR